MSRASIPAFVALSFLLVGCGPAVLAEPLNPPVRSMVRRDPSEVSILTQKPDRPFVEVAAISVWDGSFDWSSGTLFQKLRRHAARMGCDAVVVVGRSDVPDLFDRSYQKEGYLATCIQYRDAPSPALAQTESAALSAAAVSGTPTSTPLPPPTTGIIALQEGLGYRVIEVDGSYVRLRNGRAVVACGRHKVRTMGMPRHVDVPCGRTVTVD